MAKKKNKKDKKASASSDPVEAIRAAVERTFHATTDSAAGTQKRTRQLVDEVSHAAARVRTAIEELRVLDEVKGLRNDIEALGRRVAALESSGAAKPAASRGAAARPAASRSTAASRSGSTRAASTRAKTSGTSARKSTASTSRAKPRTTRSSASTRSRSPRASGGGSSS